jgi:hypothetical protein
MHWAERPLQAFCVPQPVIVAKELPIAVVEAFDLCLHLLFDGRIRRDRLDRHVLYYYRSFRDAKAVV